jgi:hypothetical protein
MRFLGHPGSYLNDEWEIRSLFDPEVPLGGWESRLDMFRSESLCKTVIGEMRCGVKQESTAHFTFTVRSHATNAILHKPSTSGPSFVGCGCYPNTTNPIPYPDANWLRRPSRPTD